MASAARSVWLPEWGSPGLRYWHQLWSVNQGWGRKESCLSQWEELQGLLPQKLPTISVHTRYDKCSEHTRGCLPFILAYCCRPSVAQSCPILLKPHDCSPPGSSVHGISQARILKWVAISSSRRSAWPRDGTHIPCKSPILQADFFTTEPPGMPSLWPTSTLNVFLERLACEGRVNLGQVLQMYRKTLSKTTIARNMPGTIKPPQGQWREGDPDRSDAGCLGHML